MALLYDMTARNPVVMIFGGAVARIRRQQKMSQEDLADKAEIHRTYVSKIELGKVDVSLTVAVRIAEALGTTISQLLKG